MAETRQPFAPAQARGHRRRRAVGPGYLVEQSRHPPRLAAVPGALQGRQTGHYRAVGRDPGGGNTTYREGGSIQFMVGAQHQGGADQLDGRRPAGPTGGQLGMNGPDRRRMVGEAGGEQTQQASPGPGHAVGRSVIGGQGQQRLGAGDPR